MTERSSPCGTDRIPERVRYFDGLLLDAHDFQTEQDYHRERSALHNRLHGWGVVCGLAVEPTDPASSSVTVSPGMAIDAHGREILLCEPVALDLAGWIGAERPGTVFVTIEYAEEEDAPVPIPTPDDVAVEASRIREVPKVGATTEDPEPGATSGLRTALTLAVVDVAKPTPLTRDRIDIRRRRRHPMATGAGNERSPGHSSTLASLERQIRMLTGAVGVLAVGLAASLVTRRRS